jgi:hypothetical protein
MLKYHTTIWVVSRVHQQLCVRLASETRGAVPRSAPRTRTHREFYPSRPADSTFWKLSLIEHHFRKVSTASTLNGRFNVRAVAEQVLAVACAR